MTEEDIARSIASDPDTFTIDDCDMSTLEVIMPPKRPRECDLGALRRNAAWRARKRWLREHKPRWEAEIERDFSPGGRGSALLDEMKADVRTTGRRR